MYTLLLATNNPHKIEEIKEIFSHYQNNNFRVISLFDAEKELNIKLSEPVEDGLTFKDNAYIKAKYYKDYFEDYFVASDDTGLMVDALGGLPGVHSKRFSEPNPTNEKNRKKLLNELANIKDNKDRSAHFETCVCLIDLENKVHYFYGKVFGYIMDHEEGELGFGYDPLFFSSELNKPFSCCDNFEKNKVSHRGRAFRGLIEYLSENY